jgi:hypothetical protein
MGGKVSKVVPTGFNFELFMIEWRLSCAEMDYGKESEKARVLREKWNLFLQKSE